MHSVALLLLARAEPMRERAFSEVRRRVLRVLENGEPALTGTYKDPCSEFLK